MAANTKKRKAGKPRRRHRNGRENRAWDETVCTWAVPIKAAVFIVFGVICLVAYAITVNSRDALCEEVDQLANKQQTLMRELTLERVKWMSVKTPESLNRKLLNHGIAMSRPRAGQRIAMSRPAESSDAVRSTYAANR